MLVWVCVDIGNVSMLVWVCVVSIECECVLVWVCVGLYEYVLCVLYV